MVFKLKSRLNGKFSTEIHLEDHEYPLQNMGNQDQGAVYPEVSC